MRKLIRMLICCPFFLSCDQITKSIDDTFKTKDTVVTKEPEKNSPETTVNKQIDVQEIIKTALETHSVSHTQTHTEGDSIDFLADTKGLEKAEAALRKLPQYTGKEIFVYATLYFYNDGLISVMLRHPENPQYVDIYEYKGNKWSEPRPLQLSVRDDVQKRLISLDKIKFSNVAKLTAVYNKKAAGVEGAKPLKSAYLSIWDNEMHWYPTNINGSRERYSIQFNEDGTLKSYKQD